MGFDDFSGIRSSSIHSNSLHIRSTIWRRSLDDSEAVTGVFYKKGVLENFEKFTEKHLTRVSFSIELQASDLQLFKNDTLAQVFCFFTSTPF